MKINKILKRLASNEQVVGKFKIELINDNVEARKLIDKIPAMAMENAINDTMIEYANYSNKHYDKFNVVMQDVIYDYIEKRILSTTEFSKNDLETYLWEEIGNDPFYWWYVEDNKLTIGIESNLLDVDESLRGIGEFITNNWNKICDLARNTIKGMIVDTFSLSDFRREFRDLDIKINKDNDYKFKVVIE